MKKTPSRQKNARLWGVFFLLKKTGVDVYDGPAKNADCRRRICHSESICSLISAANIKSSAATAAAFITSKS